MDSAAEKGRDFTLGIPETQLEEGRPLRGHVGEDAVLLVRSGGGIFAVGDRCTHYGGTLSQGLVVGDTVRCPLHHACFSLRTGQPTAPAFDAVACWKVERRDNTVFVREKLVQPTAAASPAPVHPASVVIVGGGPAAFAASDMLRREGYAGPVTMISADDSAPYDRVNVSKEYLAGEAQPEWMPLASADVYRERNIQVELNAVVSSIDVAGKRVVLADGRTFPFGALLLATGAEPVRLPVPGADSPHVHYLRTIRDADAIIAETKAGARALVIGASFIGLEVASSLRARGLEVDVIAPETVPLERVLGADIGAFIRRLHEANGVRFHLGTGVTAIDGRTVTLKDGSTLAGDLIVVGIGVRPITALAESAGLAVNRGVLVNELFETSAPGICAAGDIARYPDPISGELARIEHWVVAGRMGQMSARNILGQRRPFDVVPFFWTQQFGVTIKYVGHAERWDSATLDGTLDLESPDASVRFVQSGRLLAMATVGRDLESLTTESALEQDMRQRRARAAAQTPA